MKQPYFYSRYARTQVSSGGNLPHWSQQCATFVTFRLADSLPAEKLADFKNKREIWLANHPEPWSEAVAEEYEKKFPQQFETWLDAGNGSCILRNPSARGVVEDCLKHFDNVRYSLYAYVVMANHVHVLFMPEEGYDGGKIVSGWKSFTAKAINSLINRTGSLWQKESYDHLVRDMDEFNAIRSYIRRNDESLAYDGWNA